MTTLRRLFGSRAEGIAHEAPFEQARRGNRRRLGVFVGTLLGVLLVGQAWNFSRPAEYRAQLRLQLTLPEVGRAGRSASAAYDTKLQLLNSRPLLARLAEALAAQGTPPVALGTDPAGQLQAMLSVQPAAGSEVVEVQAMGPDPRLLADALNALPEVVRRELASRQANEADAQVQAARQELQRLERTAAERRARLEAFRERTGVIAEREDNEAVAQLKNLNQALNVAVEKESATAARLKAVTEAAEQGKVSTLVRADPTLTVLETRASQLREQLKELERVYTPDFLAMDPQSRALRARLTELERQLAEQRVTSQRAALQSAQEDFASAQVQVERLRAQLRAARPELARTTTKLAEAKVFEDDLAQVEKARREVLERVTRLEADEQRRVAVVSVIEAAVAPATPFRPDYTRDAGLVLAVAALLALAVTGTVELFNRPPEPAAPGPTTVVLTPAWNAGRGGLAGPGAGLAPLPAPADEAPAALLPAPLQVLGQAEAAALVAAARGPTRFLCAAGLIGLTCAEALALRQRDLDRDSLRLQVGGAWARLVEVPPWLPATLEPGLPGDALIVRDAAGNAWSEADVESSLVGAALDAGLPCATALNWNVLRSTAVDWLVAQGARYAELPGLVGRVDTATLQALASRHPDTARRDAAGVDRLMPALRLDPPA